MKKETSTQKPEISTLANDLIKNVGGGFFTTVIDDHHYYDENLDVQEFKDGCLYYPSQTLAALGIHEDNGGESFVYHDQPGMPKFTYYTNIGYLLAKATEDDSLIDKPIQCTAVYDTHLDLPSWMGVDQFKHALQKLKSKKEYELDDVLRRQEVQGHRKMFIETLITALILLLQSILIIPIIVEHGLAVRICYFVPALLILTRFIGRSIRLYIVYRKARDDYDKTLIQHESAKYKR